MRIGIDARFFGPIGKGLGRYTQKLIENLEKVSSKGGKSHQYFIFLKSENFDEYKPKNPNFQKVKADYRWYGFSEQIRFPRLLKKYNLDLVHFPHFNVPIFYLGKFIVTIHDLILINFPTVKSSTLSPLLYWIKFLVYKIVIKSAIARSEKIIAVSNFTKKDILKNYKSIPEKKIVVTYEACEDFCMLSPNKDDEILARYGIKKPYIMYVGNAYPHKNLERLILAFGQIKKSREDLSLVLVGKIDYFYSRLKNFSEKEKIKDIIFVGYIPDYELDTLFHNTSVYVFPSLYEGFGLPPLEAMAKGAPVASSDHLCMKEVLGESAYYFDGKNTNSISEAVNNILSDDNLRKDLIRRGYERIKKYSWKKMAKITLEVYNKARR
ncbi:MAG TPA: glycosyltransferase family 1 protein [Candidatus Moranbacteria bacterium]|nr:glycosyltransferase family 1 protein [Candidatus Moranbacteria bacterium]